MIEIDRPPTVQFDAKLCAIRGQSFFVLPRPSLFWGGGQFQSAQFFPLFHFFEFLPSFFQVSSWKKPKKIVKGGKVGILKSTPTKSIQVARGVIKIDHHPMAQFDKNNCAVLHR